MENTLYDSELDRYRETLRTDQQMAADRYGFTLLNSLDPAERAAALRAVGFELNASVDFYNLGCHAATDENWSEAMVHFNQAIKMDPDMTDAIYNLAICYEKTSHLKQARATWDLYLSAINDDSERAQVTKHMEELDAEA